MSTSLTFDGIVQAAHKCSLGVKWKDSVAAWVHPRNISSNCLRLFDELDSGCYRLSEYISFEITEPKHRIIQAPRFRDRVVQRAMCDAGLYDDLTRDSIYDNAVCQVGKGITFAIDRLKCHLQRYFRQYNTSGWVLKLDIKKFFDSIPHDLLKAMAERKVSNDEFLHNVIAIIDSFDDPGIGLGSQVSQLLAISYLSDLDHYIKEKLRIKYYVRYSDDLVLIHHDKSYLQSIWSDIESRVNDIGLTLNPKSSLYPLKNGVDFLKFKHVLTDSGGVVRVLSRDNTKRIRKRLKSLKKKVDSGDRSIEDLIHSFASWSSHAMKGNSFFKVKSMNDWLFSNI